MARTKLVNGIAVKLTEREEAVRDVEESLWAGGQAQRDIDEATRDFETDPDLPTLAEKVDALYEGDAKVSEINARIDAVKTKHGRV